MKDEIYDDIVQKNIPLEEVESVHIDKKEKWCWVKFFKGKFSNKFIAFLVSTSLIFITMFANGVLKDAVSQRTLIIIWGVVTVIYMLHNALESLISRGNLNVNVNAGAQKNITTDTAQVIKAKNITRGENT